MRTMARPALLVQSKRSSLHRLFSSFVAWQQNSFGIVRKIPESIRGEKEVQDNLTFAYDSVKTENMNKEVLEHQFVTTF